MLLLAQPEQVLVCPVPSGLVPFLLGIVATVAALAAGGYSLYTSKQKHETLKRWIKAEAEVSSSPESLAQLLGSGACGGLPSWLQSPDVGAAPPWLNTLSEQLWPYIQRSASKWTMEDRRLETLLNETTFWRPGWLARSGVRLAGVNLGAVPPRVTAVKVFRPDVASGTAVNQVTVESDFVWDSKLEVQLYMIVLPQVPVLGKLLSRASTVKIRVSDMVAKGTLRATVRPLLDELPVVGAVKASFVGAPTFSYEVNAYGVNPMFLPGLERFINGFILHTVLRPFTFPDGFIVPLTDLRPAEIEVPEGLLSVTVVAARHVPRMDLFGASDPYVRLSVSQRQQLQTSVRSRTLSPVWEEEFLLLVHDSGQQVLTLELWDSDLFRPDDFISGAELPLAELDLGGAVNDIWVPMPREAGTKQPYGKTTRGGLAPAGPDEREACRPAVNVARLSRVVSSTTSTASGASLLSDPMRQLRGLAERPLALLSHKECELHLQVQYVRLSQAELAAAASGPAGSSAVPAAGAQAAGLSTRLRRVLRGGVLRVHLDRAEGLPSKGRLATGFSRNMVVTMKVGPYERATERGSSFRHRSNPLFDETLELVVDGDTAVDPGTEVTVDLRTTHWLRRDHFKGHVSVPLEEVVRKRRVAAAFPLQGVPSGLLHMALEWIPTAA